MSETSDEAEKRQICEIIVNEKIIIALINLNPGNNNKTLN